MKKIATIWAYATLFILFLAFVLCFMSTPTDSCSIANFALSLIVTKSLCVGFGWATWKIYTIFERKGLVDDLRALFNDLKEKHDGE